ncbi:MAG: hypothetical protein R3B49_10790 [Phycisphaerales bacterium]
MSEDDLRAIVRALVARAKGGDMLAARELLNRVLGRPAMDAPPGAGEDAVPIGIVLRVKDQKRD